MCGVTLHKLSKVKSKQNKFLFGESPSSGKICSCRRYSRRLSVATFWDVAPCSPYVNPRFVGKYRLHPQGRKSVEQETTV
jgi:hypothetical protein